MLITMAVHDTVENKRTQLTRRTLNSLVHKISDKHRIMICDNGSCEETRKLYKSYGRHIETVIYNEENLGTAAALNQLWRLRRPGEIVCKMDNDVVVYTPEWANLIELAMSKDSTLGILGLKRKDLAEWPLNSNPFYNSHLRALRHKPGEPWLVVEDVNHVMGTCQAYSPALLEKIGYLSQPGVYGFDDSLASARAHIAGFSTAFLLGVDIDHIDPGDTDYTRWKQEEAGQRMTEYNQMLDDYHSGKLDIYYDGGFNG